jgi:hypothetical protein
LRDIRAALRSAGAAIHERDDGLVELAGASPAPPGWPAPRLLGPFDPLLLGWRSREDVVGGHRGIVTTNGLFRPIALVNGRAAAIWRLRGGRVTIEPFAPMDADLAAALDADGRAVVGYLAGAGQPPVTAEP